MSARGRGARGHEPPAGRLAHSCAGRTRLSFADHKGDVATLTRLCDATLALPGVHHVEGRPATGSLIVSHAGSSERLIEAAAMAGAFRIETTVFTSQSGGQDGAWEHLMTMATREFGSPEALARGAAALAFIAMAAMQASRGNIMPPASTALWYAMNLLLGERLTSRGSDAAPTDSE